MTRLRRCFVFRGHVQGVGFRATTSWLARGFEVAGHVRNLPDGSVELVLEGDPAELDRFLTAIREEMGQSIESLDISDQVPAEPLIGFQVRF